jgi:hypothetical protein
VALGPSGCYQCGLRGFPTLLLVPLQSPAPAQLGVWLPFAPDTNEREYLAAVLGVASNSASEPTIGEVEKEVVTGTILSGSMTGGAASGDFALCAFDFFQSRDVDVWFDGGL